MKVTLTILWVLIHVSAVHSQIDLATALRKRELLKESIVLLQDSLASLDETIKKLKLESVSKRKDYRLAVLNENTVVKDDYEGKIIDNVRKGDTIKIYGVKWWDLLVEYKIGKMGFIGESFVTKDESIRDFIAVLTEQARQERMIEIDNERGINITNEKAKKLEQARESNIKAKFNKFGSTVVANIVAKKIWIGMTAEMAIASWGNPDKINKTVSSNRATEQWVYSSDYLYFESGILKSFQTSR